MQYTLFAVGTALIVVGLVFAVRGVGTDRGGGGFKEIFKIEGPAWLILVAIGVVLVVFSSVHDWTRDGTTEAVGTIPRPNGDTTLARTTPAGSSGPVTAATPAQPAPSPATTERTRPPDVTETSRTTTSAPSATESITTSSSSTPPITDPPTIEPALTDCLPYDPTALRIVDEGAAGWLLTDGQSRMKVLDNKLDAEAALAVAQRHLRHCFIGRDNKRSDRSGYIVEFWTGSSTVATPTPVADCIRYNPSALRIVDEGAVGWLLTDGSSRMLMLDNEDDARQALAAVTARSQQCFIGRSNRREKRYQYIMQYWL